MNYAAYIEGIPQPKPDLVAMQARHDAVARALDTWEHADQFQALMRGGRTQEADALWQKDFPNL